MAYGHSSGLPPYEAPVMIAEKRNFSFLPFYVGSDSATLHPCIYKAAFPSATGRGPVEASPSGAHPSNALMFNAPLPMLSPPDVPPLSTPPPQITVIDVNISAWLRQHHIHPCSFKASLGMLSECFSPHRR